MAAENWMEIYRGYESAELDEEIAQLRKDARGSFTAQGSGGINHQRDLGMIEARLQAATRVRNERRARGTGNTARGRVSFGGRWGDL